MKTLEITLVIVVMVVSLALPWESLLCATAPCCTLPGWFVLIGSLGTIIEYETDTIPWLFGFLATFTSLFLAILSNWPGAAISGFFAIGIFVVLVAARLLQNVYVGSGLLMFALMLLLHTAFSAKCFVREIKWTSISSTDNSAPER